MTDCSLTLLPKPNKNSRLPSDLRPLGLQDPASKVLAGLIKTRLMDQVRPWLLGKPQFAYCEGRAVDEAVARVFQHCRHIRQRLNTGADSVHARRAGLPSTRCLGGLMVSLDLSRAFDTVTRRALSLALEAAGVTSELRELVLDLHEQCRYSVRHGCAEGSFSMECGVRQGCALSPLLYSIFTCWWFEQLADQTSRSWAYEFVTMYADDTMQQWMISSVADLHQACRFVRTTFALLAEVGMTVNAAKSRAVIRLQGSDAKRWLRAHLQRTPHGQVLCFGTPTQPLNIPMQSS